MTRYSKEVLQEKERINRLREISEKIDEGIAQSFDGERLRFDVFAVVEEYGLDDVREVVAESIINYDYDPRFGRDVVKWAQGIRPSNTGIYARSQIELRAHRCLINAVAVDLMCFEKLKEQ